MQCNKEYVIFRIRMLHWEVFKIVLRVERYLKDNIDEQTTIKTWKYTNKIPIFLRNIYKSYTMKILGIQCILLEIIDEAPRIDAIKKHINTIEKITNEQIVLYYREITRYRRKSLIQNKIPFVIEDGQIFLPFLGLHLKNIEDSLEKQINTFTPSAQMAYLYFLYNKETVVNTTEFSKVFGWNPMTSSRALNELYNAKLLIYEIGGKTGRSKYYSRISDPDYFQKGKVFLNSPIKKTVYVKREPKSSLIAGLEALSELSMINPPRHKVKAIYSDDLNKNNLEIINNKDIIKDKKLVELQIWEYDPKLFTMKDIVDTASLYASLKKENDERIEQALEEVLREKKWYMD